MTAAPGAGSMGGAAGVTLRPFPYPYRAALAICSDVDRTHTRERFLDIQTFLNDDAEGPGGPGVGLEIGNTFFPYPADDSFAYFSSRPADRETIRTLVRAGYVDCLHSYGEGVTARATALQALEQLERDGCRVSVWVDHAKVPTNLGKDVTDGSGDVPASPAYHADATLAYGVRYVWRGRATSITGQETPLSLRRFTAVLDAAHPGTTVTNVAKDLAKTALARVGNRRFALHHDNRLVAPAELADGGRVHEFKRCNSYWLGLSYGHCSSGLAYVLRPAALAELVASGGYTIVYTHLGTGPRPAPCLPDDTRAALRRLARLYREGDVYVTTTSRLLCYYTNRRYLRWDAHSTAEGVTVAVQGVDDPVTGFRRATAAELQGIGFSVDRARSTRIVLDGRPLDEVDRFPADDGGRDCIAFPRTYLQWPL
jgi:hypothetical protein